MSRVGVSRIKSRISNRRTGAGEWKILVERRVNGFTLSASNPTRADLPEDVRAGLLAWLTGETERSA